MINNRVREIHEKKNYENRKRKKCSSCHKKFDNPKLLLCRHKLCLICLQKLKDKQFNGKIKCPVCEIDHEIPYGGISNFHSYYEIIKRFPKEDSKVKNGERTTLECPICYETLENPRFLPCFHKFCLECVQKLEQENVNGKLKCPLCRKEFFVTNDSQITPNLSPIIISPASLTNIIQSNTINTVQTRRRLISSSPCCCSIVELSKCTSYLVSHGGVYIFLLVLFLVLFVGFYFGLRCDLQWCH